MTRPAWISLAAAVRDRASPRAAEERVETDGCGVLSDREVVRHSPSHRSRAASAGRRASAANASGALAQRERLDRSGALREVVGYPCSSSGTWDTLLAAVQLRVDAEAVDRQTRTPR